ncbi:MAG: cache domain-containing protein, partial [Oscillospiraceae bacterium]
MIEENKASKAVKAKAAKIRKKIGLTRRFVTLSVAPAIVIPLMLIVFSRINTTYSMTQSYSDEALSLAGAYGTAVENLMESLSEEFNVVTMNPSAVDESLSLEERKNILAQTAQTSIFKDFSVAYADGKTYNDTDISQREYFKYSMANKSSYVSRPVLRMTDNSLTIMMGRYFNSNGKDYLAYGGLDTDTFNRVIEKVHFGDSGICYILDKDGMVVASSNKELVPILVKPLEDTADEKLSAVSEISEKMMSEKEGTALVDFGGEKFIFGYKPISGGEGWTIAVGGSFAPAEKNIFWAVVLFSIITAVNVCILIPIVVRRIKLVCKPIEASAVRLRGLAEGDIASPAPECKTGDETEVLTDSLSEMIASLNGYILDIRNVLTAISSGDLTAAPSVEYAGDFAEIRRSLELILSSLNRTMAEVGRSAQEVREGAEH